MLGDEQGSVWRRWDPYIHAPGTVLNDQFGSGEEAWDQYLQRIEASAPRINALGVTDYCGLELYERVRASKVAGRLPDDCPSLRLFAEDAGALVLEADDDFDNLVWHGAPNPLCHESPPTVRERWSFNLMKSIRRCDGVFVAFASVGPAATPPQLACLKRVGYNLGGGEWMVWRNSRFQAVRR